MEGFFCTLFLRSYLDVLLFLFCLVLSVFLMFCDCKVSSPLFSTKNDKLLLAESSATELSYDVHAVPGT